MTTEHIPHDGTSRGPLDGLVVADFSRVLAGPLVTMTLADLGAEVIKVERPGAGDDTRSWGPPYSKTGATYFESVNRNKRSVTLDLRDADDLALARELAHRADVVVENFKTGGLARYGLGYEQVSTENPSVVYCSITGFGSAGGAELPGYDFIVQALGGLMHVTGEPDGDPMKVGVALVDVLTAKDATIGILAALAHRARSGEGRHVEVNLLSSLQSALTNQIQAVIGADASPSRLGNAHPSIVPYQALATADAPLAVAVGNDGQFRAFATEIGVPELADDDRFATNPDRVTNRKELIPLLEDALAKDSAERWEARLIDAGVPVGRVNTIADGIAHAEGLGLEPMLELKDVHGDVVGKGIRHPALYTPAFPVRDAAPPQLGADNDDVRSWLAAPRDNAKTATS